MTAYRGRRASLATRHGKERAITRPVRAGPGLEIVVASDVDTDALGTFSGEVPRAGTPLEVCVLKARQGMMATGLPLGLANEGSFGSHPSVPFIAADHEFLVFVDDERGIVVTESVLTERTNHGARDVRELEELSEWLTVVGFPTHALIVRARQAGPETLIEKGIASIDHLAAAIARATNASDDGMARVETDLRAHCNPTRMAVIRSLAFRLARRLTSCCPSCGTPGWGRTGAIAGLPCEWCGTPSELIRFEVFGCPACTHREERPRPDERLRSAPAHCPHCNP